MVETSTEFVPSDNQLAVLKVWRRHDYCCTVSQAMSEAGLDRTIWYDWFAKPEFAAWWQEQADSWAAQQLPRVQANLIRMATEPARTGVRYGDAAAARTVLERYDAGFAPRSRTDQHVSGAVGVADLGELSIDELQRLEHALSDGVPLADGIKVVRQETPDDD